MQSMPQLTWIWLKTVIAYPLKAPKKSYFKTKPTERLQTDIAEQKMLKQLKPEFLNLPAGVKIYINAGLCP